MLNSSYRSPIIYQNSLQKSSRTSRIERLLIFITLVTLPLQYYIPTIGGFTISFIMFLLLAIFQFLKRPSIIAKLAKHKIILSGLIFTFIALLMEIMHCSMDYYYIFRIGLMIFGALTIALFCRDRKSLQTCIYGILVGSCIVSAILFLTTYGVLKDANAGNFKEASRVRAEAFSDNVLESDLNLMSFQVGQGFLISLAMMITARSKLKFCLFLALGGFTLVTSFLPVSRGSIAIIFLTAGIITYTYGILKPKIIIILSIFSFCALLFVPEVVFLRFIVNTEKTDGQHTDGRTRVFAAALEELPNYILIGVGKKDFYGNWGRRTSFAKSSGGISAAHNCFIQVALFWGLPGLIALVFIVWQSYKYFPKASNLDPLYLCVLGISISTLLEALVIHTLESKGFSIALGLIIGSSYWVWKKRKNHIIIQNTLENQNVDTVVA